MSRFPLPASRKRPTLEAGSWKLEANNVKASNTHS